MDTLAYEVIPTSYPHEGQGKHDRLVQIQAHRTNYSENRESNDDG